MINPGPADHPLVLQRAEPYHHAPDALLPGLPGQHDARRAVCKISVFPVQRIQRLSHRHAAFPVIRRHLRDKHARADAVLVPDLLSRRTADALLIAEEIRIPFLLYLGNFAADILEAGQRLKDRDPVVLTDRPSELACHDRLDHRRLRWQRSLLRLRLRHVRDQHRAGLVPI